MSEDRQLIKVVVVGDGAVGKTCLLISYTNNSFPEKYVPTIFDNSMKEVTFKSEKNKTVTKIKLDLWDTAGQEEFDRIRYLSYIDTNVFFFCYSCVDQDSFHNIKARWVPEINYHVKDASPIKVLVGLKSDLLENKQLLDDLQVSGKEPVTTTEAENFAQENNMAFMEVSALKEINVDKVFNLAIEKFLDKWNEEQVRPTSECCEIL